MPKEDFQELASITDVDGVVQAVITYRNKSDGSRMLSVAFLRTFDDNGQSRRTPWCSRRHLDAIVRLVPRVKEYLQVEENKTKKGV